MIIYLLTALPKAGAVLELPSVFNRAAEGGRGSRTAFGFFFNRAAEGGRGSRIAFGFFFNRAAEGGRGSRTAFGFFF